MFYSDEIVEEIREKNDVVDVISGYVSLQKKGSSYFGLCPFHNEKSPSFSVSQRKQMYYCFGCGAGGNVFTFVMEYENFTFPEAIKLLADRAGITLPEIEDSKEVKQRESLKSRMLQMNKEAAKYYYYKLHSPQGEYGYQYLRDRGLSEQTIKGFGLGFAGSGGGELNSYLKSKGYDAKSIQEAGLATFNEKYGLNDKFWNRVIFPIQDANHRVIGFGGRVMGKGEPKYLNSPETLVFDKSRNLYGLNFARTSRQNHMILCEGYMDVIALHQAGFTQAVASLGTAFTPGQAGLIKRYVQEVYLSYDSDGAGTKAALRALEILKEAQIPGKVISLEPYKDPDEFITNKGREAFEERIKQAENGFMFEIRMLEREYQLQDPESKTRFHKEIARRLSKFTTDVERENYLEAVASKYHIGFDNLRKLVVSYVSQAEMIRPVERPKPTTRDKQPRDRVRQSQRLLLTWLCEEPAVFKKVTRYITPEDFSEGLYRKVAVRMFTDLPEGKCNPAAVISMFEDEEEQREVASLFNTKLEQISTKTEREKAFHDIVYMVKKSSYEYYSAKAGSDVAAMNQVIQGKKALEDLSKTHISLE